VLPVQEVPGSDSGPEIGCARGVQLFPLWAGSRAARVKITMSSGATGARGVDRQVAVSIPDYVIGIFQ